MPAVGPRGLALSALVAVAFASHAAKATPPEDPAEAPSSWGASRSLLDHFGADVARRLLRAGGTDAAGVQDALDGIDRAATLGSEEGVLLIARLLSDPRAPARTNERVLLAATRALASSAGDKPIARALATYVLNAPRGARGAAVTGDDRATLPDEEAHARLELARETAALALARTNEPYATELLVAAARGAGPGAHAAEQALVAFPPVVMPPAPVWTPGALLLAARLGDLSIAGAMIDASHSPEPLTRAAGLRGLGALGDARGVALAEAAADDGDVRVREVATEALVDLGAKSAAPNVRRLIEDDKTARHGVELARRVHADEITLALAARATVTPLVDLRASALAALGEQRGPRALEALRALMDDPRMAGDAAEVIARSDDPLAWGAIVATLEAPATKRLGARMAALRGRTTGRLPENVLASLRTLAHATDAVDRAAGLSSLALVGEDVALRGLGDGDPRVRRAVAMACEPTEASCARALMARLATEEDEVTRLVLARGLARPGAADARTTTFLREQVRDGGVDAPISALALARSGGDAERDAIVAMLGSADPLLRAHTATGLSSLPSAWASARLAEAYETETDPGVRRSIAVALALRTLDTTVPSRARALDRADRLDPDGAIRTIADRALRGLPPPTGPSDPDAAWLRVMDAEGKPPLPPAVGVLVRADGLAVPIVFDDDGYALTPAPRGPVRLQLAPGLRAYEALRHGQ